MSTLTAAFRSVSILEENKSKHRFWALTMFAVFTLAELGKGAVRHSQAPMVLVLQATLVAACFAVWWRVARQRVRIHDMLDTESLPAEAVKELLAGLNVSCYAALLTCGVVFFGLSMFH